MGSLGHNELNTLRPRQNGRRYPDDIFKWIFLNENVWISINISLKFVPRGPINNIPTLVQVMAWRRPGDKPLSEPMMVRLLLHICITRPQWVKHAASEINANLSSWIYHHDYLWLLATLCKTTNAQKQKVCITGCFNSLWLSDAWCLTTPSHYMNQGWLNTEGNNKLNM